MRRIILLLDGTWNDAELGACDTNIVRLREIISKSLDHDSSLLSQPDLASPGVQKFVSGRTYTGKIEHIIFYERGVGTDTIVNRIVGGVLGAGLDRNIRSAYRFLSFHYTPGDQIFVFGFSRGAYTARSLVGFIAAAGLLKRADCTPELEAKAWNYYRTRPNDRMPGVWHQLTPFINDRDELRIDCLGVFDTVGSLGVPLPAFFRFNRRSYEFHDVELSSITNVNLHAMAIDESRQPFSATVWRKPKFKAFKTVTEQVWFPGAHGDIGGGYVPELKRFKKHAASLDDISLDWMLKRLQHYFPDFPVTHRSWKGASRNAVTSDLHRSRTGFYRLMRRARRSISNIPVEALSFRDANVCFDRHAESIGEMIHISALERLMAKGQDGATYRPKNLMSVLPTVRSSYDGTRPCELPIVSWSGSPYLPSEAARSQELRDILDAL